MTYFGAKELAASFRTVRKNTVVIAEEIPEDQYRFKPVPEFRNVAQLLTHIAIAHLFQHQVHAVELRTTLEGFDFPSLMQRLAGEEQQGRSKSQIIQLLRSNGEEWAGWLD